MTALQWFLVSFSYPNTAHWQSDDLQTSIGLSDMRLEFSLRSSHATRNFRESAPDTLQRDHRAFQVLMLLVRQPPWHQSIAAVSCCATDKGAVAVQWLEWDSPRPTRQGGEKKRQGADLHKDALGVGAGHAMHAIEGKLEVWAAQQRRQGAEVVDLPQQFQVVLHLINDLAPRISIRALVQG